VISFVLALSVAVLFITANFISVMVLSRGKLAVYILFTMLGGMMLPFLAGMLIWGENVTAFRIAGLALLTVSLLIPVFRKGGGRSTKLFFLLCVCMFILNGLTCVVMKLHQVPSEAPRVDSQTFVMLYNLFGIPFNAAVWGVLRRINRKARTAGSVRPDGGKRFAAVNAAIIILCSVFISVAGMLQMLGALTVDASALFPMVTGGVMIFTALFGYIIMREKPGRQNAASIATAFFATLFFLF